MQDGTVNMVAVTQAELDAEAVYLTSPEHLADQKQNKMNEITTQADAVLLEVSREYGAMERATWDQQYQEAKAYQSDNQAVVPLLSAIAAGRGMIVATLADRIITNRAAWVALSGSIVGQRLAYQDTLDAATTVAEVEAIEVNYVIPA
nr:hypothetical protein [uncultured Pseudodesulfovibrio sp.]